MADVTGALHHEFGGKTFTLRLTLGGIAKLQAKYGNGLGGMLDGTIRGTPPFGIMIDVLAVALEKGQQLPADQAADLADDMLTAGVSLFEELMKAAFPDLAKAGNAKAPKVKA